jgi:hypothetical protein
MRAAQPATAAITHATSCTFNSLSQCHSSLRSFAVSFSKVGIAGPVLSSPLSLQSLQGLGHRITVFFVGHVGSCSFVVKKRSIMTRTFQAHCRVT